jgi:chloramphenicol-sensitive protein RarD
MTKEVKGTLFVTATYFFWGIQPIYWKQLNHVSSLQLIAHRIFWSFVFFMIILKVKNKLPLLKEVMKDRKKLYLTMFAGYLVSTNWLIYIYAVNSNQILATSLGYYINPLVSVILGMIILKERFNKMQIISFVFACLGVLIIALKYQTLPWIAVSLPLLFGFYGLIKKVVNIDPVVSMAIETMAIMPIGLGYLIFTEVNNTGHLLSDGPLITFYLLLTGVVTSLPLWWFAIGASMIKLSTIGFIQFLSPTLSLIIGVLVYSEPFDTTQLISFGFIWVGIAIYMYTLYSQSRKNKRKNQQQVANDR